MWRAAIVTISTSKAAGEGEDQSGPRLAELAERLGARIVAREVIADDRETIESRLRHWALSERCELVLTSGGTGVSPSDVTPEATLAVIDREIPGIAQAMRDASRAHTPNWMLSRAVAGVCGSSLLINFPGSPRSIEQTAQALLPAIGHALALISGARPAH
ncbi:MAG: MogA/MoaB family molybdenum cofactor biosynthesis protein [Solirubrobacteraceae bacterium]